MPNPSPPQTDRRQFLRMLAASPALPYVALSPTILHALGQEPFREGAPRRRADRVARGGADGLRLRSRRQGEAALRAPGVPRGTEDEGTYRANPGEARSRSTQLRVRCLVDISRIDMSVSLFGSSAHSPILLCPCGALNASHRGGEVEVARAVNTRGHIMTLSNAASQPIEDLAAARGGPVWFQDLPRPPTGAGPWP